MKKPRTLLDVYDRFKSERLDVTHEYIETLRSAVDRLHMANDGPIPLRKLTAEHIRVMMRTLLGQQKKSRTVNGFRRSLLTLWNEALDFGWEAPPLPRAREVRRLKEAELIPTAWRQEQMQTIIDHCAKAPTKRGWGAPHWTALVLTAYETSLRRGALMRSEVSQVDPGTLTLYVPGELQKSKRDTRQPISKTTCDLLLSLPRPKGDTRLFPWPFAKDEMHRRFTKEILIPAGLPHTHRDKFHKLRRTSYSLIYKEFGVMAASEHASHKEDLSRFYLDRSILDRPNPLMALPSLSVKIQPRQMHRIGTVPSDWQFDEKQAAYCGQWFEIPSRPAITLLKRFVSELGGPIHWETILRVIYGDVDHGWKDKKHRAEQYVERLRGWMRDGLELSKEFQPLIEKNGSYTLCLPVFS